jgi:protocatechuate 3,4-dioxygenase beta subunit
VLTLRSTAVAIALVPVAMMLAARSRPIIAAQGTGDVPVSGTIIDSRTERPLADVVVTLGDANSGAASVQSSAAASPSAIAPVVTDSTGRFLFASVPRGTYRITAAKPGYGDGGYGQTHPNGSLGQLVVDGMASRDAIAIRLWKLAAIEGTVVDESNEPVVAVPVHVLQRSYVAGRRKFAGRVTSTTDDRGMFRIANLRPGDYIVCVPSVQVTVPTSLYEDYAADRVTTDARLMRQLSVVRPPLDPTETAAMQHVGDIAWQVRGSRLTPPDDADGYPTTCSPGASSPSDAELLSLESGDVHAGVAVHVQPVRIASISGTLTIDDRPAPQTAMRLVVDGQDRAVVDDPDLDAAATLSDKDGRFTFLGVPQGNYLIRVSDISRRPGPMRTIETSVKWAAQPVTVDRPSVTGIEVPLHDGLRVTGRVRFDGISGSLARSSLPSQVQLVLEPVDGRTTALSSIRPSADGSFVFGGLEPGRFFVRVRGQPDGWTLAHAWSRDRDVSDEALDLRDRDVDDLDVVLTMHASGVAGTTLDPGGRPSANAMVALFPTDRRFWIDFGAAPRRLKMTRTSAQGAFNISGIPAGQYIIAAYPDALANSWNGIDEMFQILSTMGRTIEVKDGEVTSVTLPMIPGPPR